MDFPDIIFKMFGGLPPDNRNGIIFIDGNDASGSGCSGCGDDKPSDSPRDDVLNRPSNRNNDFVDINSQYGQGAASNSQRNDVLKQPRRWNETPNMAPPHGNFRFENFEDDFMPRFFNPFQSGRGGDHNDIQDLFDGLGLFMGMDPFDPFNFRNQNMQQQERQPIRKEDVDLDSRYSRGPLSAPLFDSFSSASRITTRSDGFFQKRSTWRDGNGNLQVKTVTRDQNGVEIEKIEKHLPDGTVETVETKKEHPYGQTNTFQDNKPSVGDMSLPFNTQPYMDILKKPLFKNEIFMYGKDQETKEEIHKKDNNPRSNKPSVFERWLSHLVYGK